MEKFWILARRAVKAANELPLDLRLASNQTSKICDTVLSSPDLYLHTLIPSIWKGKLHQASTALNPRMRSRVHIRVQL
jgi:hypothetical protein